MKKRSKVAVVVFLVFYITFGAYLSLRQERMIYQPWPQDFASCAGFRDAEKVIHKGTRMYVSYGERGTVVLYHGNAGSACQRDFYARMFTEAGFGYVIVEYAGYSNDPRRATHERVKRDVRNVISYLEDRGSANALVTGVSIGTGAASYHVSRRSPARVLLISPFASLADVAQRKFWFYPTRYMVDNAFDNIELLQAYSGPITIVHGEADRVIPQASGRELYEQIQSPDKIFVSVPNVGHNNLFSDQASYDTIRAFLHGESNL